jgi:eukaryotic-like serine/threonine-protein kinase
MAIGVTKPGTPAAGSVRALESAPTVAPNAASAGAPSSARLEAGAMIADRYRIVRVLGEGGMGVVYAAEHALMRKEVALKVLHAEMCSMPEVVARFEREAIAAAHIDHPNVAGATDFGRLADGSCYLVLELLRGRSLREEISRGPFPRDRALAVLRGISAGVAAAHAKSIIHRDLKPENVMLVERDGIADFVKVLDFGIAKVDPAVASASGTAGHALTRIGTVFGTPEYMAPEQAVGDAVDARADLYALGVILLEMLTGKCPFTGNAMSILRARIIEPGPPDLSAIPDEDLRDLVTRLLARQPADRYQTATELVAALDAMIVRPSTGSHPIPAPTTTLEPSEPPVNRSRWFVVAAVAALVGAGLSVFVLARATPAPPTDALAGPAPTTTSAPAETTAPDPEPPAASAAAPADTARPAPATSAASARAPHVKPRPRPKKNRLTDPFKDIFK